MASQSLAGQSARDVRHERDGRIAFRANIGITGHRSYYDEQGVADRVAQRLREVRAIFPATDVTPVVYTVLTALAEGADRLVARVAPHALDGSQVEIEAVLPLTVEDYLEDFETEASRQEFMEMLDAAAAHKVLTRSSRLSGDARDAAYERVGRHIVDRSDVVLAIWDGRDPRGRGGTAEIIEYARAQEVPLLIVPAPGRGEDRGNPAVDPQTQMTPSLDSSLEALRRIDEYNRASVEDEPLQRKLRSAYAPLDALPEQSPIREKAAVIAGWAVPHYVRADVLAIRHQSQYRNLVRAIHFLAAFAVAAVAFQIVFFPARHAWLVLEIGLLLMLIAAVWAGRRGRVRERWIGYRSLAEAFRAALFMAVIGAPDREFEPGPERRWFQRAFSEAWAHHPKLTVDDDEAPHLRRFLLEGWLDDQIAFHENTAARHRERREQYTWIVYALAGITVVIAGLHIAGIPHPEGWSKAFTFIAIVLPGFGAAVTGLRESGQHRLHEERSRRTARRLQQLKTDLGPRDDLAAIRGLAFDAQRTVSEENLDWSGVIEFQDLEMVI